MRINEIFYSLQGEGVWTGCPAVFVRFSGCNRACDFCDTDYSDFSEMSEEEIVEVVHRYPAEIVVFTGGEPGLQLTQSLVDKIKATGRRVHVETNGSLRLPDGIDWITCSPKTPPYQIEHIDELKVLLIPGSDPEAIIGQLPQAQVYCLQPLSCSNTDACIDWVKQHPRWRLSLQTHKLLNIP